MESNISEFVLNFIGGNSAPETYTMADAQADISNITADRDGEMPEWLTSEALYGEMQRVVSKEADADNTTPDPFGLEALGEYPAALLARSPKCVDDAIEELYWRRQGRVVSIDGDTVTAKQGNRLADPDLDDINNYVLVADKRGGTCEIHTDRNSKRWWIASWALTDGRTVTVVQPVDEI